MKYQEAHAMLDEILDDLVEGYLAEVSDEGNEEEIQELLQSVAEEEFTVNGQMMESVLTAVVAQVKIEIGQHDRQEESIYAAAHRVMTEGKKAPASKEEKAPSKKDLKAAAIAKATKLADKLDAKFGEYEDAAVAKKVAAASKAMRSGKAPAAVKALTVLTTLKVKPLAAMATKAITALSESYMTEVSADDDGADEAEWAEVQRLMKCMTPDRAADFRLYCKETGSKMDTDDFDVYWDEAFDTEDDVEAEYQKWKACAAKVTEAADGDEDDVFGIKASGWVMSKLPEYLEKERAAQMGKVTHVVADQDVLTAMRIPFEIEHDDYGQSRYFRKGTSVIAVYQRGWDSSKDAPLVSVRTVGKMENPAAVADFVNLIKEG